MEFDYLTTDCLICGSKLLEHKNTYLSGFTYFCKNSSEYSFSSHYEIIVNFSKNSLLDLEKNKKITNIILYLDSMKYKVDYSLISNNYFFYVYKNVGTKIFQNFEKILQFENFDLISFLKDNTKIELMNKIDTMLVFS